MLDVEGFILVGGKSSRMGTDKSEITINGQTTVSRIIEALRPVTTNVRVVGSQAETGKRAVRNVPDVHNHWGPLGGIQAALRACGTEYGLIVACDLPFVTSELFARLLAMVELEALTDAFIPIQSDGRPQPLCGVYKRKRCLIAADASIAKGEHSPRAVLDKVNTRYVDFSEFISLSGAEHFFVNLNRPEDYQRAKLIAGSFHNREHEGRDQ